MGVGFGYSLAAYQATIKGLGKIIINATRLEEDLMDAWEVLAEPVQTVMRKLGKSNPYEQLKELTRGKKITAESMRQFIQSLDIPADDKTRLLEMTPARYVGIASTLVSHIQ
jgi:adenylosuccinate lyase